MRRGTALVAVVVALTLAAGGWDGDESPGAVEGMQDVVPGEPRLGEPLVPETPEMMDLGERTPGLLSAMGRAADRAYATLDRKAAAGSSEPRRPAASTIAFVPGGTTPFVPGVHVPIKEHTTETDTTSAGTTTIELTSSIADQVVTMSVEGSAVPASADDVAMKADITTRAPLCQPPDVTAVTVHVTQTRRARGDEFTFQATGTFVQGADGLFRVDGLDIVLTSDVDGVHRIDHQVVDAKGWDTSAHGLLSDDATYRVLESHDRSSGESFGNQVAFAGLLAQDALRTAAKFARSRTESGGYCVRLLASSDTATLAAGESADIAVDVVDARTGEPVDGATVTASGLGGEVAPVSVPAPGRLRFTATGKPSYWAFLEVRTPRGGDDAVVRFDAAGWRFEGTSYTATAPGRPAPIEVTTTWRGELCGDPFTDTWHVQVTFSSAIASHSEALEDAAKPLERAPFGVGARLLIAEDRSTRPGFRLWVDDVNPAARPSHHRVEVTTLEPVLGACVS